MIQHLFSTHGRLCGSTDFTQFIQSFFSNPDRMIILAAALGVLALFIITRGKWR
jgi:hypothetical protein